MASTAPSAEEDELRTAQMQEDCYQGVDVACQQLTYEEEAKRAWLSKLEVSSWGKVAEAVKEVAEGVADRNGTPLVIPKTRSKKKAERAKAEERVADMQFIVDDMAEKRGELEEKLAAMEAKAAAMSGM